MSKSAQELRLTAARRVPSRRRGVGARVAVAIVVLLTVVAGAPVEAVAATGSTSLSFAAVADSYVSAQSPASNFGREATLRIDGSPVTRAYVRFDVEGITGRVASAHLRLLARAKSTA